jgi:hypothetical protein
MAEVLIRAKTNGPDAMHWKQGDIVYIAPDGHAWGRMETKSAWVASGGDPTQWSGDFWLVKVPGVAVAALEYLRDFWGVSGAYQGKRLWRLAFSELPNPIRNRLDDNGEITLGVDISKANAAACIRRKDTEATANLG